MTIRAGRQSQKELSGERKFRRSVERLQKGHSTLARGKRESRGEVQVDHLPALSKRFSRNASKEGVKKKKIKGGKKGRRRIDWPTFSSRRMTITSGKTGQKARRTKKKKVAEAIHREGRFRKGKPQPEQPLGEGTTVSF